MSELGRNSFLNAAKLSSEQVQQMNDSQLESLTSSAKDVYLVAKVKQVEKIESKLEKLEAKKASELEKHRSKKPGRFAPKDQKKEWETKDKKLKSELNSIQLKKSVVQTIKESMYEGSPRIEYLAEKKMKFFESDLNFLSCLCGSEQRSFSPLGRLRRVVCGVVALCHRWNIGFARIDGGGKRRR